MQRRTLIALFAVGTTLILAGCEQPTRSPNVSGYWLQHTEQRPMSLHIKPDGKDYIVNVGRLNFGTYDISAQPATLKTATTLTINDRKQLRFDEASDSLTDIDHPAIRFARITQTQYEQITQNPTRH